MWCECYGSSMQSTWHSVRPCSLVVQTIRSQFPCDDFYIYDWSIDWSNCEHVYMLNSMSTNRRGPIDCKSLRCNHRPCPKTRAAFAQPPIDLYSWFSLLLQTFFFTPNVHFIFKEKIRIEYINKHSDIFRSCILWFKFKFNANNKNPIQNVWMFEYLLWMLLSNNTVDTLIAQMYLPCKIGEWASWWHYRKTIIICCCLCIRLSLPNAKWTINANSQIIWPFELWTICKCITSIALRCAHFA